MTTPAQPKIYHIVHIDRLPNIIADENLWCDAEIRRRSVDGTTIGINDIKQRRLKLPLASHRGLCVGDCVPFYFCPRSIMLYLLHKDNHPNLNYHGGQDSIIHLEGDFRSAVAWASQHKRRWAFTSSNAGSYTFQDYCDFAHLGELNWKAIDTHVWSGSNIDSIIREQKQAEFLLEYSFPWRLVERIGVYSQVIFDQVIEYLPVCGYRPPVAIKEKWYY